MSLISASARRIRRRSVVVFAAVCAAVPAVSRAADSQYVGGAGAGSWSAASNWSPAGVPGAGTNVNIVHADALDRTVNYDYAGPAVKLGTLTVDQTGSGTNTLALSAGFALTTTGYTAVGIQGTGGVTQDGGTHTADELMLGVTPGSRGTYALRGGELVITGNWGTIGYGGTGVFDHSGGTSSMRGLLLANQGGSSGTYRLSGSGRLTVTQVAFIGTTSHLQRSDGLFEQSGGVHTSNTIIVGSDGQTLSTSRGTYRLSGGSLVATWAGVAAAGTFEQTGGTHDASTLALYGSAVLPAAYTISAGELRAGSLSVGGGGVSITSPAPAALNVEGGTVTVSGALTVPTAVGAINLSGGTVRASVVNHGTLTQTGGRLEGAVENRGVLNLDGGAFAASLVNHGAAHVRETSGPYGGDLTNAADATLTVSGTRFAVSKPATNAGTIRVGLGGSASFSGGLTGPTSSPTEFGRVVVEAGGIMGAKFLRQNAVVLNGSGGGGSSRSSLSLVAKAQGGETSVVRSLSIETDAAGNPGGRFSLWDAALVVDYAGASPMGSIRSLLVAGRNGGTWDGNGLTSNAVAVDVFKGLPRALGYGEASTVLGAAGGTFEGVAVDGSAVLVRYTLAGDATLDGAVNFDDLLALASRYNQGDAHWGHGDFDYSGRVDFDDLLILAGNYNRAAGPVAGAPAGFDADVAAAFAAVPEPGVALLGFAGALGLLGRERRSRGRSS